jgi:hypothetical protein
MVKLLILVTLVTMVIVTQGYSIGDKLKGKLNSGKFNFKKFMNRRDPFPEPENPPPSTSEVTENWITQRLDNFDPTNNATWEQRFMMSAEHFQPGGCIFLFLAGEWSLTPYRLEFSLMEQMSREFECAMLYLEHRFYGESRPTEDASDANLRFLSVEQALADTAHFVTNIKTSTPIPGFADAPVIVIGGHYSASLAVWFRQKFPHLAIGAWASAAPLESVVDHFQFKELAGAVYRHIGGNACYDMLERGFAQTEQMIADGLSEEVQEIFFICEDIVTEQDIQIFFATISAFYSLLAEFEELVNIEGVCNIFLDPSHESPAHAIAEIIEILIEDDEQGCVDVSYERVLYEERQTDWNATALSYGIRQWSYQSCSQFVWYHSSTSRFQPFGSSFPVEFIYRACEDVFGPSFNEENLHLNSDRFNTIYGALNPQVTNVLFVHGQYDPWRSSGVQHDLSPTAQAIVIQGASQGNDLGPLTDDDSPALAAAKVRIQETIRGWILEAGGVGVVPV